MHQPRPPRPVLIVLVMLGVLCGAGRAPALQVAAPPPAAGPPAGPQDPVATNGDLTTAQVTAERERVAALTELEPAVRDAAVARYGEALDQLTQADAAATRRAEFERQISEAPGLLAGITAELGLPPANSKPQPPPDATLNQVVQLADQAEAELVNARKQLADLLLETDRRSGRRKAIPEELAVLRQQLSVVDEGLAAAGDPGLDEASRALKALRLAHRKLLTQSISELEKELASYDVRAELLPKRKDRAQRRVAEGEALATAWRQVVQERRAQDTRDSAERAKLLAQTISPRFPSLQAISIENAELTALREGEPGANDGVTALINDTSDQLAKVRKQLSTLRADRTKVLERIRRVGLNDAMGLLLRKQIALLPDVDSVTRDAKRRARLQTTAQVQLLALEERRAEVGDVERLTQEIVDDITSREDIGNRSELEAVARSLLTARRDTLDQLQDAFESLQEYLFELEPEERRLVAETDAFRDYIDERILWVRSIPRDKLPELADILMPLTWLLDPTAWWTGLSLTGQDLLSNWGPTLGYLLALLAFTLALPICRRHLASSLASARERRADNARTNMVAMLCCLVLAAYLPAVLALVAWLLARTEEQLPQVLAGSAGLLAAARVSWPLLLVALVVRRGGVGDVHFRWPAAALDSVRRHTHALLPVLAVSIGVAAAVDAAHDADWIAGLGRLAFLVGMGATGLFALRTLGNGRPLMSAHRARHPAGPLVRFHWIWYSLSLALPLACMVLSVLGFHATAARIAGRCLASWWLVLALVLANAMAVRWQFLVRRHVALEQARQKRESSGTTPRGSGGESDSIVLDADIDLLQINARTRQLFQTLFGVALIVGAWLIWFDVLPALRQLDRFQIWPEFGAIAEETYSVSDALPPVPHAARTEPLATATPNSTAASGPGTTPGMTPGTLPTMTTGGSESASNDASAPLEPVTLADLGLALLILCTTLLGARNLPAVLEMALISRASVDSGARHAVRAISSYTIVIVGTLVAFGAVGIGWNQVQWLAAALTFGLAFGLQEIFANFVSGLIILIERPVRLGDIVTVGETQGKVTRIRIRSTTITDWGRRELLVPNKEFITGQVINWSLTDSISREVIEVGVAYGSDVALAQKLLLEIAHTSAYVLKDPAPSAIFRAFGDSTLNFELRVFMESRDVWLNLTHDINERIHARFAEAGIEIAFPQRDLHLRSLGPLQDRLPPAPPAPPSGPPD